MKKVLTPARGAIAAALILGAAATASAQLRPALEVGERATKRAEEIQTRINQLDDQRSDLVREFRTVLQRKDAADLFARQQQRVIDSQAREIESLTDQLGRVDEITAQMIPMMLDMIADLEAFVAADLPFKSDLRRDRLDALTAALDDPQVPPAEAYRLIIEAYQAEMEYGSTVDTWTETIDIDGAPTDVEMFQYGRIALVYLAPGGRAARWSRDDGQWVSVPGSYAGDIREAIRVAEGKTQQTVLFAPVQKYQVAQ
ncbi:MAG: DUF3450 domain-containing protein [Pseudomonadota bacterium]